MDNYEEKILRVCEALRHGTLLIGAGAGLSAAAGLDYSGPAFRREFADYIQKYGFQDLYSSGFYEFPTEEERWARWARHINYTRFKPPALPLYRALFELAQGLDYFVVTTNVDGQFIKAGFSPQRLFEVQGNYGLMQCAKGCHSKVYPNEKLVEEMIKKTSRLTIPPELVPHCPVCGGYMDVNLRKNNYFVEDAAWHLSANRYQEFLKRHDKSYIVLLELGVGFNTPGIIRFPFEELVFENHRALLVRINRDDPDFPKAIFERTVIFQESIENVLGSMITRFCMY